MKAIMKKLNCLFRFEIFKAFTLAEILITLGIIGVVASLTIPNLIKSYQKQATVSRVEKIYSEIFEALKMSEANNGLSETWSWSDTIDLNLTKNFASKYFYPYIKTIKQCNNDDSSCWKNPISLDHTSGYLQNSTANTLTALINGGYSIYFWTGGNPYPNHVKIWFDIDGPLKGEGMLGKDIFGLVYYLDNTTYNKGLSFLGGGEGLISTYRDYLKNNTSIGCSKDASGQLAGLLCGALIQMDGWKISDDYPW